MCYEPKTLAGSTASRPRVHTKIDGPPPQTKTRTAKEWFDTLPSPYREQALTNEPYERWYRQRRNLATALSYGFSWSEAPEGYAYWRGVFLRADKGEFNPKPAPAPPEDRHCDAPLPEGFSHWEYRGLGWSPRKRLWYARALGNDHAYAYDGFPGGQPDSHFWEAIPHEKPPVPAPAGHSWVFRGSGFRGPAGPSYIAKTRDGWGGMFGPDEAAVGLRGFVYWEAVKDAVIEPTADPVCPLPVPEGFSHWEYRGVGYSSKGREGQFAWKDPQQAAVLGSGFHVSGANATADYWEAIPKAPKPKVVGYRLLGPDDVIARGDEVWDHKEVAANVWSPMAGSFGFSYGSALQHHLKDTIWRRPITSYDDAPAAL